MVAAPALQSGIPSWYPRPPMPFTRKRIRLAGGSYAGKRLYFVTICTNARRSILRDHHVIEEILDTLRKVSSLQGFVIHAYCFMPDHLHLLCEGATHGSRLLDFLSRFKQRTAFAQRQNGGGNLWQGRSYDRVLRREDAVEDVGISG
jgi:putative transposase